ncbi:MAG: M50 family metallopeptidase [Pseudonocardiaceae bacterium]
MGFADTDRNRAAVHEAGHALVAASRGVGVATIKLYGSDGAGETLLREKPLELDLVWILYGGPFAEEAIFGKWTPTARPTGLDDLLFAHRICRQIGINNITEIANHVEAYLRERRVRLELIAARLLTADTVQGAELDELLREDYITSRASPHPDHACSVAGLPVNSTPATFQSCQTSLSSSSRGAAPSPPISSS